MDLEQIKSSLSSLSGLEIIELQQMLGQLSNSPSHMPKSQELRRYQLDNKLGCCGHCGHTKYVKFGIDKGHNAISVSYVLSLIHI